MDFEMTSELTLTVERLAATAAILQQTADRMTERESSFTIDAEAALAQVVATAGSQRETDLEKRLAAAELHIAELRAHAPASVTSSGRKTLPVAMVNLLAKQGLTADTMEAGTLDTALVSLSLEQRIAVKAQLMRAGLLG